MSVSKDGEITVIVVNNKEVSDQFNLSFEENISADLRRYVFDPATCVPTEKAERILSDKTVFVENSISDSIAPYSVIVYTNTKD